jgi:uncharacterized membrane protein YbhN (UPF0104 family)
VPDRLLARAGNAILAFGSKLKTRPSQRTERALMGISFALFVIAGLYGALNFPAVQREVRWEYLAVAAIAGMPPTIALNAVEFQIIGRLVQQRISFGYAIKVTIVGSAANMLPIPGSTLVRIQALAGKRARYRDAITASIVIGVLSVAANFWLATLALVGTVPLSSITVLACAAVAVTGGAWIVNQVVFAGLGTRRFGAYAFGLELVYATVTALRLWLVLVGLGMEIGVASAFALTAAGSIATAVGFFPAGLGLREALMGAVSPLVGIPVAAGLAGSVLDRLFWFAVLAVASVILLVRDGSRIFRGDEAPSSGAPKRLEGGP